MFRPSLKWLFTGFGGNAVKLDLSLRLDLSKDKPTDLSTMTMKTKLKIVRRYQKHDILSTLWLYSCDLLFVTLGMCVCVCEYNCAGIISQMLVFMHKSHRCTGLLAALLWILYKDSSRPYAHAPCFPLKLYLLLPFFTAPSYTQHTTSDVYLERIKAAALSFLKGTLCIRLFM